MNVKSMKKGFTLTELIIVIVIIGILAGVLIPTFINVVNKANRAADISLIRNLNEALTLDRYDNGEHKNMTQALEAADDYGFNVAKISAKVSKNEILWDSKNDVFCYLNNGEIEYYPQSVPQEKEIVISENVNTDERHLLWIIDDEVPSDSKYSVYLYVDSDELIPTINVKDVGFDAGKANVGTVNYTGTKGHTVVIRTNSVKTSVVITAASDTVHHYDVAGSINIVKVASNSYHEYGTVPFIQIANGRIALEKDSKVAQIHLSSSSVNEQEVFDNITIAKEASVEMPDFSRDDVDIPDGGKLVVALQEGTEDPDGEKDYVWLTKQGIYEQVIVSDQKDDLNATGANNTYADQVASEEKQDTAKQIANNITTGNIQIGETTYNVEVVNREVVVTQGETLVTGDALSTVLDKAVSDTGIADEDFDDYKAETVNEGSIELGIDEYEYWIEIHSEKFAGGDGSAAHPYQISNGRELALLAYYMNNETTRNDYKNKHYVLIADIDLSGKCWTPISNMNRKEDKAKLFSGTFDGQNHTISGLTTNGLRLYIDVSLYNNETTPWNSDGEYSYGLFGTVYDATLENIIFTKVSIKVGNGDVSNDDKRYVGDSVGTLAGAVRGTSIIRNIDVKSGTIEGYDATGGVVGRLESRSGDTCSFTLESINNSANVTAIRRAGGLIGYSGGYYFEKTGEGENEVLKIKGSGYAEWASFKKCTNTGKIISLGIDSDFEEGGWGYYGAAALCCVSSDAADTNNDTIGELSELASRYNALGITKAFINSGSTKNTVNGTEYNNTYIIMNNLHELD